jgi:hypothetical protein
MTSDIGQLELIAHEFAHHLQFRQGMTYTSYLREAFSVGYHNSMFEAVVRDFASTVRRNYTSGVCR